MRLVACRNTVAPRTSASERDQYGIGRKSAYGCQQSQTGCVPECQLQLPGLNAFNTNCSPLMVLSNQQGSLDADENWWYAIFKSSRLPVVCTAIRFADVLINRDCISQHFSRSKTPDLPCIEVPWSQTRVSCRSKESYRPTSSY